MRIIIITQDDPFFLPDTVKSLLTKITPENNVCLGVITHQAIDGKRNTFVQKSLKTLHTFGIKFFSYYSSLFIYNKVVRRISVAKSFSGFNIPVRYENDINGKVFIELVKALEPDVIISISSTQIFKAELLSIPTYCCLNLHSADLPKNRGLLPTFWTLFDDDEKAGVTVFKMDEGIDTGPVVRKHTFPVNKMSHLELVKYSKDIGVDLLEVCITLLKSSDLVVIENNKSEAGSYRTAPTRLDVLKFRRNGKRLI